MNNFPNNYTPIQQDMAIITSRFQLGKTFTEELIDFTHYLMNEGYYDDVMLDIIDNGMYWQGVDFLAMIRNLGCQIPTVEQAQWILCYSIIHVHCYRPYNHHFFQHARLHFDFFHYCHVWDNNLMDMDNIISVIHQHDNATEARDNGYVQKGFNDPKTLFQLECELLQECENWLTRHQMRVESIFNELFLQK